MKGGAPGKLGEVREIVVDHPFLELLKSLSETSFDDVEISPDTSETYHIAACTVPRLSHRFNGVRKTIEGSPGRVDIACRVEASAKKGYRCGYVVGIDGESAQCAVLRIPPLTQCQISHSNSGRDLGIARVEFLRSLRIRQRMLPFAAAPIDPRAICSGQSIVGLQFQRSVELPQRILVLAMPIVEK